MTLTTLAAAAAISTLPMNKTVIHFKPIETVEKQQMVGKQFERHMRVQIEPRRDRATGRNRAT